MSYINTDYIQGFIKASEIKTVDLEPRPKRCQMADCKAKLSLTDSPCKCKQIYCMKHRHAELHSCTYDFRADSNEKLKKDMTEVRGQKLDRI